MSERTVPVPVDHIAAMKKAKAVIDQLLAPNAKVSALAIYVVAREAEIALRGALLAAQGGDIESEVCADILARQKVGIEKYGTTLAGNPLPLREWLQHAYEESLDLPLYLKRAMKETPGPER